MSDALSSHDCHGAICYVGFEVVLDRWSPPRSYLVPSTVSISIRELQIISCMFRIIVQRFLIYDDTVESVILLLHTATTWPESSARRTNCACDAQRVTSGSEMRTGEVDRGKILTSCDCVSKYVAHCTKVNVNDARGICSGGAPASKWSGFFKYVADLVLSSLRQVSPARCSRFPNVGADEKSCKNTQLHQMMLWVKNHVSGYFNEVRSRWLRSAHNNEYAKLFCRKWKVWSEPDKTT